MKKFIVLLSVLLFTGCSSSYNLTVDNNNIFEDVLITIPNEVVSKELFDNQVSYNRSVYGDSARFYKMTRSEDDDNYYVRYSYTHNIDDYTKSNFLNKCFESNEIINDNDSIKITTSDLFQCIYMEDDFYMDEVMVNITTKLNVVSNNADKVNGNTYTWIFNDGNYDDKSIVIEMKKENKVVTDDSTVFIYFIVICSFAFVLGFGLFLFIRKKNIVNNDL